MLERLNTDSDERWYFREQSVDDGWEARNKYNYVTVGCLDVGLDVEDTGTPNGYKIKHPWCSSRAHWGGRGPRLVKPF